MATQSTRELFRRRNLAARQFDRVGEAAGGSFGIEGRERDLHVVAGRAPGEGLADAEERDFGSGGDFHVAQREFLARLVTAQDAARLLELATGK